LTDVEFRIEVHCPVGLTLETAKDVVAQASPKWRMTRINLQKQSENVFECKVGIDPRDISRENTTDLVKFRDTFLSLFSLTAMVPVRPLMKGTFTFPLGDDKYAQISLGPMNHTFPGSPMLSLAPLVEGFAFDESYRAAVWFVWQAINSSEPIHRFLNLGIAYELVIGRDSPIEGSKPISCQFCRKDLSPCPFCGKEIKITYSPREKARFMFADEKLLAAFIEFRNNLFHGRVTKLGDSDEQAIYELNTNLLVNIRNYFGKRLGLKDITATDIGPAINVPDILVTLFYEHKEKPPRQA
jgi:hypothetical protein